MLDEFIWQIGVLHGICSNAKRQSSSRPCVTVTMPTTGETEGPAVPDLSNHTLLYPYVEREGDRMIEI